jgi:DDE superfamily endonuclease
LRYEVALCIRTGDIVWVSGPFPAGQWPDLKIFRLELKHYLGPGERVEADKGYRGEYPLCVKTNFPGEDPETKRMRRRVLARHETVNKRFKHFAILRERFRHEKDMMGKHGFAFRAIVVLTQLSFYDGAPLNQVYYVDM